MTTYMSFEWLKLSKRTMPRIIFLLLLGGVIIYFWGQGSRLGNQANLFFPRAWLAALFAASFAAPFLWPVLGGSWAGSEYGWGTIRTILTRKPYRIQYLLASLGVLLIALALALLLILVAGTGLGVVVALLTGHSVVTGGVLTGAFFLTVAKTFLVAWYVATFFLVLAFAAAIVFRSSAVGIGIGLGSTLAQLLLYRIFRDLGGVWDTIAQHFPLIYAENLTQNVAASGFVRGTSLAFVSPADPSVPQSLVALAITMAILLGAAILTVRISDVTA